MPADSKSDSRRGRKESKEGRRPHGPHGPPPGVPRLDAANLAGLTSLMNPQHVRPEADLREAERRIMGRGPRGARAEGGRDAAPSGAASREIEAIARYSQELSHLATELGINFTEGGDIGVASAPGPSRPAVVHKADGGGPGAAGGADAPFDAAELIPASASLRPEPLRPAPRPPAFGRPGARSAGAGASARLGDLVGELDLGFSSAGPASGRRAPPRLEGAGRRSAATDGGDVSGGSADDSGSEGSVDDEDDGDDEDDEDSGGSADGDSSGSGEDDDSGGSANGSNDLSDAESVLSGLEKELGIDLRRARREARRGRSVPAAAHKGPDRSRRPREDGRRDQIDDIMGRMRHETRTSRGQEQEQVRDAKNNKIEQIGQLRMILEEEGLDCSAVGSPTIHSSMEEIDSVLNILRLKNDRNRCSTLAEELILGGAEIMGTVLDGTRQIPLLKWQPDYTDYHNTVNAKLHRMRFETAQIVGDVIKKYHISSGGRILLELVPSLFLYPMQRRKHRGQPSLGSDPDLKEGQAGAGDARRAYSAIRDRDSVGRDGFGGERESDDIRRLHDM